MSDAEMKKGLPSQFKHTQALSVKQIHAINSSSLIRQTSAYFHRYSDPKNHHYAHWLAPRLNEFLIQWARMAGLDEPPIATLPDPEHEIKRIDQLRIQFLAMADSEQQQLATTKISSVGLSIGIDILSTGLLQQHQAFLQQHGELMQQLQQEIDRINVNQLMSGLPIRSDEIAAIQEKINRRIAAEQMNLRASRFSQRQRREISDYQQQQTVSNSTEVVSLRLQELKTPAVMTRQQFQSVEGKNQLIEQLNNHLKKFNENNKPDLLSNIFDTLVKSIQFLADKELLKACSVTLPVFLFNLRHSGVLNDPMPWLNKQRELAKVIESENIVSPSGTIYILIQKFVSGLQAELARVRWLQWLSFNRQCGNKIAEEQLQQLEAIVQAADMVTIASLHSQHPLCINLLRSLPVFSVELPKQFSKLKELTEKIAGFNQMPTIDAWKKIWKDCCEFLLSTLETEEKYRSLLQNNLVLEWIIDLITGLQIHLHADNLKLVLNAKSISESINQISQKLVKLPVSVLHECFPSSSSSLIAQSSLQTWLYAFTNANSQMHILPILRKISEMKAIEVENINPLLDLFAEYLLREMESVTQKSQDLKEINKYLCKAAQKDFLKQKSMFYFCYLTANYYQNKCELSSRLQQRNTSSQSFETESVKDFYNAWKDFQRKILNDSSSTFLNKPEQVFSYCGSLMSLLQTVPDTLEKCRTIIQNSIDIVHFEMHLVNNIPEGNSLREKCSYICEEKDQWRLAWCEDNSTICGSMILSMDTHKELTTELRKLLETVAEVNITENNPQLFGQLQRIIIEQHFLNPARKWQKMMEQKEHDEKNLLSNFAIGISKAAEKNPEEKIQCNIDIELAQNICACMIDLSSHLLLIQHWQTILNFRFNYFGKTVDFIYEKIGVEDEFSDFPFLNMAKKNFNKFDIFFKNFYETVIFCLDTPDFSQNDFFSLVFDKIFSEIKSTDNDKRDKITVKIYNILIKEVIIKKKDDFLKLIGWVDGEYKHHLAKESTSISSQNVYYFLKTINSHTDRHENLLMILQENRKDKLLPKVEDRMQIICDFLNLQYDHDYSLFTQSRFILLQKLVELRPEDNKEPKSLEASWKLLCHVEEGLTELSAKEIELGITGFQHFKKIMEKSDKSLSDSLDRLIQFFNIYSMQLIVKNFILKTINVFRCKNKLPSLISISRHEVYFTDNGEYCFEEAGPVRMAHVGYGLETRNFLSITSNKEISEIKLESWKKYALLDQINYWKTGISPWLKIVIDHPQYLSDPSGQVLSFDPKNINHETLEQKIFLQLKNTQHSAIECLLRIIKNKTDFSKDKLKTIIGYVAEMKEFKENAWLTPQMIIEFSSLIYDLAALIGLEGFPDDFDQLLQIISCFDQLTEVIAIINTFPRSEWQRKLLLSHLELRFSYFITNVEQIELLRDQLELLDFKILLCFHNKFIKHLSKKITSGLTTVTQRILEDNITKTVKLMIKIKVVDNTFLSRMHHIDFSFWESILSEEIFIQIFNGYLPKIRSRTPSITRHLSEKFLFFANRIRITWKNDDKFYDFIIPIFNKLCQNEVALPKILKLLTKLYYGNSSIELGDIQKKSYKEAKRNDIDAILKTISATHDNYPHAFTINNLFITELKQVALTAKALNKSDGLEAKIRQGINVIRDTKSYQENPEQYMHEHLLEITPLILCAWAVANHRQFPHDTQIVTFWSFVKSTDHGLLAQVRTGEGKTLIVGLLAAFLALCGHAVDVLSSNSDLAIEGVEKCRDFFQLLLLTCGHICHRSKRSNHQAYKADIVYGEIGSFQGDFLQQEFEDKQTYRNRYSKTTNPHREKNLIVDEVDSMGLDKAGHVLYLSHPIESLKWLDSVYLNIWAAAMGMKVENPNDVDREIATMSTIIIRMVDEGSIFAPPELIDFVKKKVPRWIASAVKARFMVDKDNFVIDINKNDENKLNRQKDIVVIDKDTGVEQYSTRWSEGLAQFLWLKYRRKFFAETLKALFISNKKFFHGYGKRLYGLTGTLGSEDSKGFLSELYWVKLIEIPPSITRSYVQHPGTVAINERDWLAYIADKSLKIIKERPVLIICENVEFSDYVWEELKQRNVPLHKIKKYARADDKIEEHFRYHPAAAGDIIIATNKGGRGTDIRIIEQFISDGGLHVISTYLPSNIRVEEQAFGRAARNGQPGSGEFILCIKDKDLLADVNMDMKTIPEQTSILSHDISELIIEKARVKRDALETERLSRLKQKDTLQLDTEEMLFFEFVNFKKDQLKKLEKIWPSIKSESKKETEDKKSVTTSDRHESDNKSLPASHQQGEKHPCLAALDIILKDRWSFWLDAQKDKISTVSSGRDQVNIVNQFKRDFCESIRCSLAKLTSNESSADILATNFIATPTEAILLADTYLKQKHFNQAMPLFQRAIELKDISGRAYIGKLFCFMQSKDPKKSPDEVKQIRRMLKQALSQLQVLQINFVANLKIYEMLAKHMTSNVLKIISSRDDFYSAQIQSKLEVLSIHIHYLQKALGTYVEPDDLIPPMDDNKESPLSDGQKDFGRNIFNLLKKHQIIYGYRLKKKFISSPGADEMRKTIKDKLDPALADPVISVLREKKAADISPEDFNSVVCSREELWKLIVPVGDESVYVLDTSTLTREIEQRFETVWSDLESKIDVCQVDLNLFNTTFLGQEFKVFLEKKKFLYQSRRFPLKKINLSELKFEDQYVKYRKLEFSETKSEQIGIIVFLKKLFAELEKLQKIYLYEDDLPFLNKEREIEKDLIFSAG